MHEDTWCVYWDPSVMLMMSNTMAFCVNKYTHWKTFGHFQDLIAYVKAYKNIK